MQSQRFNYILQLRGAAALSVVIYHHCDFFWTHQDFCARLTHHQPIETAPQIATILSAMPINLGDLGVATFFLISGFLMPLVAQQKTRLQFITRRIKRIYPPYLIALLLLLLLGYCYAKIQGKPYQWSPDHIIASLLLTRDIAQYPFIDGIVWTLEIELKFYLLCMLALPWLSKNPVRFIGLVIGLSALTLVASSVKPHVSYPDGLHLLNLSAKTMHLITFIGFGVLLSFWHQQRLSLVEVMIATVMLAILYFSHGIDRNISYQEIMSYALALLIFTGSYLARHKFNDQNVLAQTGKISYSLYLVHGVPGFFMLYALLGYGAGMVITVALMYSMVAALIFYRLIERPLLKKQSNLL